MLCKIDFNKAKLKTLVIYYIILKVYITKVLIIFVKKKNAMK